MLSSSCASRVASIVDVRTGSSAVSSSRGVDYRYISGVPKIVCYIYTLPPHLSLNTSICCESGCNHVKAGEEEMQPSTSASRSPSRETPQCWLSVVNWKAAGMGMPDVQW